MIDWGFALQVLQFVLWAIVGLYAWSMSRQKATREQVEAVETRVAALEREHATLCERVRHVPRTSEFEQLRAAVTGLDERSQAMLSTVKSFDSRLTDIHSYLLNHR